MRLSMLLLLSACSLDGRAFFELPVTLSTDAVEDEAIELTEATLGFSDLRLRHHDQFALNWIPTAYAHPGHEAAGDVVGELLGTWSIDLLDGPTELGVASAIEGPVSWADATLAGPALTLAGTRHGEPFDVVLDGRNVLRDLVVAGELNTSGAQALHLNVDLAGALESAKLDHEELRFEMTRPERWKAVLGTMDELR